MNLNWLTFMGVTGLCYLCYYLGMIIYDSMQAGKIPAKQQNGLISFPEEFRPEKISPEDFKPALNKQVNSEPASVGLGGVSLQDLFVLARQDALEFTSSVSF